MAEHGTLIGGVAAQITGAAVNVGGVVCPATYGWCNIGGVQSQIDLPGEPPGNPLAEIVVGTTVNINENGLPVPFYVAKHDYESGLNGAGRTLLVRKECYDVRAWNDIGTNTRANVYETSTIDSWLNTTYHALFDENIAAAMGTTTFYYTKGALENTIDVLERAVFLLSIVELSGGASNVQSKEGTALEITEALNIAYIDGVASSQWTRSPNINNEYSVALLTRLGDRTSINANREQGARPVFTLPGYDVFVDENNNVITA